MDAQVPLSLTPSMLNTATPTSPNCWQAEPFIPKKYAPMLKKWKKRGGGEKEVIFVARGKNIICEFGNSACDLGSIFCQHTF